LASHARGPDRLGVHDRGAGLGVPSKPCAQEFAQFGVQALPGTVDAPLPEPVVDGLPGRELSGQKPPRTAALEDVEDGVEDRPQAMKPGAPFSGGFGKMRADATPFLIGQIRRVSLALHSAERRQTSCSSRSFQTVSRETVWKVPGRVGSRASWWRDAPKRVPFRPVCGLGGPRNEAYSEFPDSL
jgi:hypothetical protein